MPALYTHQILAEEMVKKLPEPLALAALRRESEYCLGAQGGDPFYLYEYVSRSRSENVGTLLHRTNVYRLFLEFLRYLRRNPDPSALSYALGYISHYAADVFFHPYVYWAVDKYGKDLPEKRKNDKLHFLIEADIDAFFTERYRGVSAGEYVFPLRAKDIDFEGLCPFFRTAFHGALDVNAEDGEIERAVRRFLRYQRLLADKNCRKRGFFLKAEKFLGLSHSVSFLMRRSDPDGKFLNECGEVWFYPESPSITRSDSVWQLAEKAVAFGAERMAEFMNALEGKGEISLNRFGLNFNTGI